MSVALQPKAGHGVVAFLFVMWARRAHGMLHLLFSVALADAIILADLPARLHRFSGSVSLDAIIESRRNAHALRLAETTTLDMITPRGSPTRASHSPYRDQWDSPRRAYSPSRNQSWPSPAENRRYASPTDSERGAGPGRKSAVYRRDKTPERSWRDGGKSELSCPAGCGCSCQY